MHLHRRARRVQLRAIALLLRQHQRQSSRQPAAVRACRVQLGAHARARQPGRTTAAAPNAASAGVQLCAAAAHSPRLHATVSSRAAQPRAVVRRSLAHGELGVALRVRHRLRGERAQPAGASGQPHFVCSAHAWHDGHARAAALFLVRLGLGVPLKRDGAFEVAPATSSCRRQGRAERCVRKRPAAHPVTLQ
jgi:hypothetical protein